VAYLGLMLAGLKEKTDIIGHRKQTDLILVKS